MADNNEDNYRFLLLGKREGSIGASLTFLGHVGFTDDCHDECLCDLIGDLRCIEFNLDAEFIFLLNP